MLTNLKFSFFSALRSIAISDLTVAYPFLLEETNGRRFISVKHYNMFDIPSVVAVETEDDDGNFVYEIYALDEIPMNNRYEIKFVASLPTLEPDVSERVSSHKLDFRGDCSICMDDKPIETCLIPCMHVACDSCIFKWFRNGHKQCPMCRSFPTFTGHIYSDATLDLLSIKIIRIKRLTF